MAISDWLADEALHASKSSKTLATVKASSNPGEGEEYVEVNVYSPEIDCWVCGLAPKRQRTEHLEQPDTEVEPVAQNPHPHSPYGGKAGG